MGNYGFKVSQPGYSVLTATPSQLVFSSKYQTLKVQQQGSGSITHSGGRQVTIPHNLGYVPMFLVHSPIDEWWGALYGNPNDYFIAPFRYPAGACWIDRDVIAWADSNNLYIKVRPDFGWLFFGTGCEENNYAWRSEGLGDFTGCCVVGQDDQVKHGAFRFENITLAQSLSVYAAQLLYYVAVREGSDPVKMITYGIDEDNTLHFGTGTFPIVRPKTTAYVTSEPTTSQGGIHAQDVKAILEEIIGRGGWTNGNAIGFILNDNGTIDQNKFSTCMNSDCGFYCSRSYLKVLKNNALLNYKYTIYLNEINP